VTPPPSDSFDAGVAPLDDEQFDDAADAGEQDETDRSKMSFLEHLEELRKRIIHSLYSILISFGIVFAFLGTLNRYMLDYFTQQAGGGQIKLIATELMEGFMFQFKLGLLAASILAAPFLFMQLWLFVAPGLYAREKKVVVPFVASAAILFGTGVWFAHFYAFPAMVKFFATFSNEFLTVMPQLSLIFGFYVKTVLALGIIFELPVLVFFLARFGIVTARFMIRNAKYAVLVIFILAAVITPTGDPVSLMMFAGPMCVLYVVSIGVAWLFGKKKPATI
jgi:sec-independent protein translocase protein TatC